MYYHNKPHFVYFTGEVLEDLTQFGYDSTCFLKLGQSLTKCGVRYNLIIDYLKTDK